MAALALAELAHRAAYAPAGPVGALRFTLVGEHWTCRLARTLEREGLAVFRSLEGLGQAAALSLAGAQRLAASGMPLPPRRADLAQVRDAAGAGEPAEGGVYLTPWLAFDPAVETRPEPEQLTLFPAQRRSPRRWPPRRRTA